MSTAAPERERERPRSERRMRRAARRSAVARTRADASARLAAVRERWERDPKLGRALDSARSVRDRIGAALAPITGLGWAVIAALLVTLWAGAVLQWKEALVLAIVLAVLLLAAIGFIIGRNRYRIELDLNFTRVVVGERALGRIGIHSASQRPLLPATIEVPVGAAVASFHLPRMRPGDVHEDVFAIPTSKRAVLQVGPVRSVRGDALGLLRRQVRWTDPVELFVHPRTVQLADTAPGIIRDLEGIETRDLTDSDISFHALRDYVPGDDRRYIHWKSSARTGTLMVRQFEQTRRSMLALGLSTFPEDYASPEEFETAISVLGSLGLQAIRDEMDLVVRSSRAQLPVTSGKRMLDALSGVLGSVRDRDTTELARTIGREHADASIVILHTGSMIDAHQVRRLRTLLPVHARFVLVTAKGEGRPAVRQIGDATHLEVSSVHDLPRALRAVTFA
ncbi:DUF58 domain-containing protein [Agrococcus sp. KRD186]|uniref:DUF58 domain-containing protein n=1 Tax=Agrococcus sp. KRD186 TaxID=2729730 RepID=UPI0019D09E52|nr:DUF58 domain-containing protein [Agrococcus sp. KRD186]